MTQAMSTDTKASVWTKILKAAMAIPGAKVNREDYLGSQLKSYCADAQVCEAIKTRPSVSGVDPRIIDKISDAAIKKHTMAASSISFATGLPGGWAMTATIPADVAQYYWHMIVLSQKLAYLYGWPNLFTDGEFDEETEMRITLLIGAMMGAREANRLLSELAKRFAGEVAHRLPRQALTKTAYYPIIKQIGKWIGVKVTKQTFARGVSKVIPVAGAVISAGVTAGFMLPSAKNLKKTLKQTRYAFPGRLDVLDGSVA